MQVRAGIFCVVKNKGEKLVTSKSKETLVVSDYIKDMALSSHTEHH